MEQHDISPERQINLSPALPDRRAAIAHHMESLEELADPSLRTDGWTPFARKLFLQVLAETGRVTAACDFAQLSKQSAYALRARDPLFAAGWDAACELARMPLADALFEQALDGVTETITRDDGRTATRHRFDSRLSIAVLNRLDRRCDRAADQGSRHLGAIGAWNEFTAAIGQGDESAAQTILDAAQNAKLSQASQLPYTGEEDEEPDANAVERVWWHEDFEEWRTDFPPPEGFDGAEKGEFGRCGYSRALTAEELDLVKLDCEAGEREERAADEAEREAFFGGLRSEFSTLRHPGLEPGSTFSSGDDETQVDPGSSPG